MTSELDLLADARPELSARPDDVIPPAGRQQLLETITASPREPAASPGRPHPSRRRRWTVAAGLSTAAAIVAVVISVVLPTDAPGGPGRAGAATLERLAVTAAGGPVVYPGQFDFLWRAGSQHLGSADAADGDWNELEWIAPSGERWSYVDRFGQPFCGHTPAGGGNEDFDDPTPAFLATLPTDPNQLRAFLRRHVHGSKSTDEAVFVAVGDMLRTDLPGPQLRAALFRVLKQTGHVSITPNVRDAQGKSTVRVDFIDESKRNGEVNSLYFDPATSRVTEETLSAKGRIVYRYLTVRNEIVNSVPPALVHCASDPHNHGLSDLPVN